MKVNHRSFGRTGPAHVLSCGCDVLPWIDCGHTAWDSGLTLERVIERQQEEFHFYSTEPTKEAQPAVRLEANTLPLDVLMVLARCRNMAQLQQGRGSRLRREKARKLLADIDSIAPGGFPA